MASTQETGHAKNFANLQDLISFVTSYGTTSKQYAQISGVEFKRAKK